MLIKVQERRQAGRRLGYNREKVIALDTHIA